MLVLALAAVFLLDPPQITDLQPTNARVVLENVAVQDGNVTGTLRNETGTAVRSVTLLVQHHYRWPNEFKPGSVDPGRAESVSVSTDLPAGGRVTFATPIQEPQPLGDGGHFETAVKVIAFEQVYPPPASPAPELPAPVPQANPPEPNVSH
jgi:hypothetical protein